METAVMLRRIDDLGRIVIPKEIRRMMKINEGEPLEISYKDGQVVLKKYSALNACPYQSELFARILSATTKQSVVITDTDKIVAESGSKKSYLGQDITPYCTSVIRKRDVMLITPEDPIYFSCDYESFVKHCLITPIICNGDAIGSIILFGETSDVVSAENREFVKTLSTLFDC